MKSQTKNSKNHTNGVRKSQQRSRGQRPNQQSVTQGKGSRAPITRAPVAIGNRTFTSKPRYRNVGDSLVIAHNEYIGDITGNATAFNVASTYVMNPGNQISFPWLSQIATRYESYRFTKLNYRFLTERPTTEAGYVALVPDYDPSDPAPAFKQQAFQYESTAKAAPWENVTMFSHPKNLAKRKSYYVRTTPGADPGELPLSDTGNLFVCVGGNSGSVVLGELWCDYEVIFDTPQTTASDLTFVDSLEVLSGGTLSPTNPSGTNPNALLSGPTTNFVTMNNDSSFTFNVPYKGLIVITVTGTVITGFSTALSTCTITGNSNVVNGTGSTIQYKAVVQATQGQNFDYSVVATTVTASDIRMGRYSGV